MSFVEAPHSAIDLPARRNGVREQPFQNLAATARIGWHQGVATLA